jgi:DNA-directed RNA polymerase subunit alpha
MIALILNVKQLRVRLFGEDTAQLRLTVRGEGVVTAADLEAPANVEIINPDLYLLTADSSEADLDIEMGVISGRGYSPAEDRARSGSVGEIPVDAIFSPVRKCNYTVERARIGQVTDYDRLLLEIWTDATVAPADALAHSAKVLVDHFALVAQMGEEAEPEIEEEEAADAAIPAEISDEPIEELNLSVRAYNCLKRAGITKVGEVLLKLQKGEDELLVIRNFGRKSLVELVDKLEEKGYLEASGITLSHEESED